jgi:hypothetical protein
MGLSKLIDKLPMDVRFFFRAEKTTLSKWAGPRIPALSIIARSTVTWGMPFTI